MIMLSFNILRSSVIKFSLFAYIITFRLGKYPLIF